MDDNGLRPDLPENGSSSVMHVGTTPSQVLDQKKPHFQVHFSVLYYGVKCSRRNGHSHQDQSFLLRYSKIKDGLYKPGVIRVLEDEQLSDVLLDAMGVRHSNKLGIPAVPEFVLDQVNVIFVCVDAYPLDEKPVEDFHLAFYNIVYVDFVHFD